MAAVDFQRVGRFVTWGSIVLLCLSLIYLTMRLDSSRHETEAVRQALMVQQELSNRNRETLRELCRTNAIMTAIVTEDTETRRAMLAAGAVPKSLRTRWETGITIYEGFSARLAEQTACREIVRP